jgi:tripartite-type tricarboxylate transporter receptor subunit TctC
MQRREACKLIGGAFFGSGLSQFAIADSYPSRTITIVVPFTAGGSIDLGARIMAEQISKATDQTTLVENKVGANGGIGWGFVAKSKPDGYTLLSTDTSFTIAQSLSKSGGFDAIQNFNHIITAISVPNVLVVNPNIPAKTIQEFIALIKANPGKYFYGSGGVGTNNHLSVELFKDVAGGLSIDHIAYKGASAVQQDLIAGRVHAFMGPAPTITQQIKSGQLRALLVTGDKRIASLPDVPCASESGLSQLNIKFWVGLAAPAGTPVDVINKLNATLVSGFRLPVVTQRLTDMGFEVVGKSPAETTRFVKEEVDRWAGLVKSRNIQLD